MNIYKLFLFFILNCAIFTGHASEKKREPLRWGCNNPEVDLPSITDIFLKQTNALKAEFAQCWQQAGKSNLSPQEKERLNQKKLDLLSDHARIVAAFQKHNKHRADQTRHVPDSDSDDE